MSSSTVNPHRQRLLAAMAEVITQKGYAATTVADVVAAARVSRRTFYQHFADKQACFLQCYHETSQQTLTQVYQALQQPQHQTRHWQEQISVGVQVFLHCMQAQPEYMRILYIESLLAGAEGLQVRRQVLQQFSQILVMIMASARQQYPALRPLPMLTAMGLVGAINELLLQAFEQGQFEALMDLAEPIEQLLYGVLYTLFNIVPTEVLR